MNAGAYVYLSNNTCLQVCPSGTYANFSIKNCSLCAIECLTCNGSTTSDCFTCKNLTNNNVTTNYYKYIGSNICATTCPLGQFISANFSNNCQACHPSCVNCSVISTNCTANAGCNPGYYYYDANSTCINQCPPGTFANLTVGTCQNCTDGCELCYSSSLTKCTKCVTLNNGTHYYKIYG